MGALAVTGNKHYQEAFGPMIPGIRFAQYNNLESVKELVNEKTCAIIFETVQERAAFIRQRRNLSKVSESFVTKRVSFNFR